jgi:hypothetical protein
METTLSQVRKMPGRFAGSAWLAVLMALLSTGAQAQGDLTERRGIIECGGVHITATALCHGNTSYCVVQTLTFSGRNARATLAPYRNKSVHRVGARRLEALDYHAGQWACTDGAAGGRYLVVSLHRAGEDACRDCGFEQVYHLAGRLLAAGADTDDAGRLRENPNGKKFIASLTKGLRPEHYRKVYGQ